MTEDDIELWEGMLSKEKINAKYKHPKMWEALVLSGHCATLFDGVTYKVQVKPGRESEVRALIFKAIALDVARRIMQGPQDVTIHFDDE